MTDSRDAHVPASTMPRRIGRAVLGPRGSMSVGRSLMKARALSSSHLHPTGRRSTSALESLRDRHAGDRCVIIGNGPSLNKTDLSLLRDQYTFGLNRIYLLFEELGWSTTFHVVVNQHVVEQCQQDFLSVPGPLFTTWPNRRHLNERQDVIYLQKVAGPQFSSDVRRGVWEGATVTYVAMQLAYHMGFEEVVLVGVDHRFADKGPAHKLVTATTGDNNHFHPDYFGPGFRWQLPDLETSELAYSLANATFKAAGRRVVDATVDGALQIFPKARLETVLQ